MSINFLPILKASVAPVQKKAVNNSNSPISFTGSYVDTFERNSETNPYLIRRERRQAEALKKQQDAYEIYRQQKKLNPKTAFLYDPYTSLKEKERILEQSSDLISVRNFCDKLGITKKAFDSLLENGHIEVHYADCLSKPSLDSMIVDVSTFKNSNLVNILQDKKDVLKDGHTIMQNYNMLEKHIYALINSGELVPFSPDGSILNPKSKIDSLYDVSDSINSETLKEFTRCHPQKSKYYYGKKVPACYLSKLGFGSPSEIRQMVARGNIVGNIEAIDTPDGRKFRTTVDLTRGNRSEDYLFLSRKNNPLIVDEKQFAKKFGIRISDVSLALKEGEIEIIPEAVFLDDAQKLWFNLDSKKNQAFVEKTQLQKFLEEQLKTQKQQTEKNMHSLKMKLAWELSPETRKIASQKAQDRRYIGAILDKEAQGIDLSGSEIRALNGYRKTVWAAAGTDEFKAGLKSAKEYVELFLEQGLSAIKDKKLRDIMRCYL